MHHEFLPEDQTVNKEYYLGNNSWILHHNNAPSHNAIVIREHLAKNETNTIQQPPNSPDLAPCDFFLFGMRSWKNRRWL